ncbi:uncharacterized protein LOC123544465 [Mercenaria mercenaria]|uniref:uncharacterized protein LOC123544465 n=1 Tax=Mercenaria mercenaria TaxID=6596 RepID=UPI00234F1464|nr:uncharacterized protein LOC123544465 [Mercenaria mercenaria]
MSSKEFLEDKGSEEIVEMYCELCKKKGKNRSADGYCVDCVRYLCGKCLNYHTEFLPDHVHKDKTNMPQDVCFNPCPGHEEEIIKFYCSSCNTFFCSLCKKNSHKDCTEVNHLPELVKQLEKGQEFSAFKRDLEALVDETSSMDSFLASETKSAEAISETALSKIELLREQILKWVETRIEKMKSDVKAINDKDMTVIQDNSSRLSVIMSQTSAVQSDIVQKLKDAKRCELFMTMKSAQNKGKMFEDELRRMKEHHVSSYEFESVADIEHILQTSVQLGKIVFKQPEDTSISKCLVQEKALEPNPVIEMVDVETQKTFIANKLQRPLIKGDAWYILDEKWFKQWKSYVGYESWDHYNVGEQSAHPGPIDNTPVLQEGTVKLEMHLIDDLDYQLVPEEGWNKLLSWYGILEGQEPIPRQVIEEGKKSLKVEVYPWYLKLCENSKLDLQVSKQFSRVETVGQLEEVMRKQFSIPADKEVRLWWHYNTNICVHLNKKNRSIQNTGLYNCQVIVIEQKNCDGLWPRDT